MKTAIRLDDITPDMDWEKFYAFKKILDAHKIRPLIGVVPFNEDDNLKQGSMKSDYPSVLKELQQQGWVIALHGYKHLYTTKKGGLFPLNHFSEFAGVPYEKQRDMIQKGKAQLEDLGIHTDIFMAPAHSFDRATLKALKENGFNYITDGFSKTPYRRDEITFLPVSVRRSDCFLDGAGYTTLVVHVNSILQNEFKDYEKMIEEHSGSFMDYRSFFDIPAKQRSVFSNLFEYELATLKRVAVKIRALGK